MKLTLLGLLFFLQFISGCGIILDEESDSNTPATDICPAETAPGYAVVTNDYTSGASVFYISELADNAELLSNSQSTDVFLSDLGSTFAIFNRTEANLNYLFGTFSDESAGLTAQTANDSLSTSDPTSAALIDCSHLVIVNRTEKKLHLINTEDHTGSEIKTNLIKPFRAKKVSTISKEYLLVTSQGTNDTWSADGTQNLELFEITGEGDLTSVHVASVASTHPIIISNSGDEIFIGGPCLTIANDQKCTSVVQSFNVVTKELSNLIDLSNIGYDNGDVENSTSGKSPSHMLLQGQKDGTYYILEVEMTTGETEVIHTFGVSHKSTWGYEVTAFGYSEREEAYYVAEKGDTSSSLVFIKDGEIIKSYDFEILPKSVVEL